MEKRTDSISSMKRAAWSRFILTVVVSVITGILLSQINLRLDMTEDKRYTLSDATLEILKSLDEQVYIQVYLDGDMPVQFRKLRRSVRDILDEFRVTSGRKVGYSFINPSGRSDISERNARQEELIRKGLVPIDVQAGDEEGGTTIRTLFPGLIVNYNGVEIPVNFLRNNQAVPAEQNLLNSVEGLEYEIIQTIYTITSETIRKIAFVEGHGESDEIEVADITLSLARFFTIDRGSIRGIPGVLDDYSAVIVAGPSLPFSEEDKFVIDQYIMRGGRVLWLYEEIEVNRDSLSIGETIAVYEPLNLADQLFRYGARVNPVLIQDMECSLIPLQMVRANQPQIVPVPWNYSPLLVPSPHHPVTRNLTRIRGEFVSSVDTVGLSGDVKKSILLTSSVYSRTVNPPIRIALSDAGRGMVESEFNRSHIPVAVLLEGEFESAFRNRVIPLAAGEMSYEVLTRSRPAKMIVVADSDIIKNEVSMRGGRPMPMPLGHDRITGQIFGNSDFIINAINYLVDDAGLMELRAREMRLRLLDRGRVRGNLLMIQVINIVAPLLLLALSGVIVGMARRRRYGQMPVASES